jgi:hypothetical protein
MGSRRLAADARGLTPVVSKALGVSLLLLYVGLVATSLYGGVVPDYRDEVGRELGERTLAGASLAVEDAVPPSAADATATRRVDLPATIRGSAYEVRVANRSLVLDHPRFTLRRPLTLPNRVVGVSGGWDSTATAWVRVEPAPGGVAIRLVSGDRP